MVYAGKLELKLKARVLRGQGLAIKEIQRKLRVSRSSVSLWVRDIELTKAQLAGLYLNKRSGNLRGSIIAAIHKKRARAEMVKRLLEEGRREVGSLSNREKFLAGVALYFAEGDKGDSNVSFSNSDPRSVVFMARWLRVFCGVPKEKFRCSIYLHDNLDEAQAKRFWSVCTGIPLAQFRKTYIVKNRKRRLRKVIHQYGVCRITVSDVRIHRKIMGWIAGLFQNIIIPA